MELHLGRNQILVGQQLQLPHPAPFHQLQGDVLRVGTQPVGCSIHNVTLCSGGVKDILRWIARVGSCSDVPGRSPAIYSGRVDHELTGTAVIFVT